jgi:acetylornithine deacetylase/succinyl-diaminopimelate desuccinylase-like protein
MFVKDKEFIKKIEKITRQKAIGENSSNEGSYFSKYGYNCLVLGPGCQMSHKANEYVEKEQLNQAIEIYKKIIKEFCA